MWETPENGWKALRLSAPIHRSGQKVLFLCQFFQAALERSSKALQAFPDILHDIHSGEK